MPLPAASQHGRDIAHHLTASAPAMPPSRRSDVPGTSLAGSEETGGEDEAARDDALRIGADGRRRVLGGNDLF